MGSINEQYAHRAGVSATEHIDGLKKGDDKLDPVKHIDGVEDERVFETDAPQTEEVDPEAAAAMSSSSVTFEGGEQKEAKKTPVVKKTPAPKKAAAKKKS